MTFIDETINSFADLELSESLLKALADSGYETPTPIQAKMIPAILSGRDVLGQAQTGTGKTAAFALPILERIDLDLHEPQALILTPTRELAIQVAESFKKYAAHIKGFKTIAVYGGQEYGVQLRALNRGAHVVVGTPGRVMDHIDRQTLNLDSMKCLVLDEADEMLRMGFKEDVEWILERAPEQRQIALFSATIPADIKAITRRYLNNPQEIQIRLRTATVESTRQRILAGSWHSQA
jgi:ATP-dependent RNA helicase DeaD